MRPPGILQLIVSVHMLRLEALSCLFSRGQDRLGLRDDRPECEKREGRTAGHRSSHLHGTPGHMGIRLFRGGARTHDG